KRYCDEAVLFFDADAAGRKAAERAEELLEPTGSSMAWAVNRTGAIESSGALRLRVALLPAGHDPDTFLRERGAAAFEERIAAPRCRCAPRRPHPSSATWSRSCSTRPRRGRRSCP